MNIDILQCNNNLDCNCLNTTTAPQEAEQNTTITEIDTVVSLDYVQYNQQTKTTTKDIIYLTLITEDNNISLFYWFKNNMKEKKANKTWIRRQRVGLSRKLHLFQLLLCFVLLLVVFVFLIQLVYLL